MDPADHAHKGAVIAKEILNELKIFSSEEIDLIYSAIYHHSDKDSALEKMLYLASGNVIKKWTQRYRNWDQVLNQLIVLYPERLTPYL